MRATPADPESIPQLGLRHDGAPVIVVRLIVSALPYLLKHDPEKCVAVFRKDHAQTTT
jgi:hypothetical protein